MCDLTCDLLVIHVGHVFLLCDPTCDLLVIHVGTQTIFVFENKSTWYIKHKFSVVTTNTSSWRTFGLLVIALGVELFYFQMELMKYIKSSLIKLSLDRFHQMPIHLLMISCCCQSHPMPLDFIKWQYIYLWHLVAVANATLCGPCFLSADTLENEWMNLTTWAQVQGAYITLEPLFGQKSYMFTVLISDHLDNFLKKIRENCKEKSRILWKVHKFSLFFSKKWGALSTQFLCSSYAVCMRFPNRI